MAITFVGSATAVGGATSTTITLPTVLQDDIVLTISTMSASGTGGVPTYRRILPGIQYRRYKCRIGGLRQGNVRLAGHQRYHYRQRTWNLPISHVVMAFRGVSRGIL